MSILKRLGAFIKEVANIDAHIDSSKTTPCIIVKVKTDTLLPDSSLEQLTKWLKVRLQTETIEIDNTTNRLYDSNRTLYSRQGLI